MPILHAIVLGIVQGLTEFLPISSSGHLIVVPWLFGWDDFDGNKSLEKAFDVALHLGTLVAVVAYFWPDLKRYVRDGLRAVIHPRERATPDGRLAWLLVLSAVPAALVGAAAGSFVKDELGTIPLIAISSIVFALLLYWADHLLSKRSIDDYGLRDAVLVGAAQVLALNPGTSRSGITITAARWLKFNRDSAARISFLMAIPITAGAIVFELGGLILDGVPKGLWPALIAGIVSAGLSGWLAIWGTLKLVRTHSFTPFVIYRVVLGVGLLVIYLTGLR